MFGSSGPVHTNDIGPHSILGGWDKGAGNGRVMIIWALYSNCTILSLANKL